MRQVLHQVDEPHPLLAEQVFGWNRHVGEGQLGGVLGVQPDLVQLAAAFESSHAAFDDQQTEPLRTLFGIRLRHHDH